MVNQPVNSFLGLAGTSLIALSIASASLIWCGQIQAQDYGELSIIWASIIDNGEGAKGGSKWNSGNLGKHGPIGDLHILIYEQDQPCPGRRSSYPTAFGNIMFPGPIKDKWNDGDQKYYRPPFKLFGWRSANDAVKIFIYESDPDSRVTNREHNPLFCRVVRRADTNTPLLISGSYKAGRAYVFRGMPKMFVEFKTISSKVIQGICYKAVQGKIAWNYSGNKRWNYHNIERLCQNAENSYLPARCFERVMHGGINWGGGTQWNWKDVLELCQGTRNANATISCFQAEIRDGRLWYQAIDVCKR